MQELVRDALADGAIGFTSSQLDLHVAHDGRGVPSNHAAPEELVALASVLGESGRGAIEFIPRTFLTGYSDDDRALIRAMAAASGRPVNLNTLTMMPHAPDGWRRSLEFAEAARRRRPRDPPDVRQQPPGRALLARRHVPLRRDAELPRHPHAAIARARRTRCATRRVREQMRTELADPTGRSFVFVVAGAAGRDGRPRPSTSSGSTARSPRSPRRTGRTRSTRSSTCRSTRTSRRSSCSRRHPTRSAGPRPRP